MRLKLGRLLERGTLVRLFDTVVASPYAHYLCWQTAPWQRWECAAFAERLRLRHGVMVLNENRPTNLISKRRKLSK